MVASGKRLLSYVSSIYNDIDSGINDESTSNKIELFQKELDEHVMTLSRVFDDNKNKFLSEKAEEYKVTNLEGFIPLEDRYGRLPVTSKGIASFSVYDVSNATQDVWANLSTLDSIDAFEHYRKSVESSKGGQRLSVDEIVATITEPEHAQFKRLYDSFDNVSYKKLDDVARRYEALLNDVAYDYTQDYPEFVMNNPELTKDDDSYTIFLQSLSQSYPGYILELDDQIAYDEITYNDAMKESFAQSSIQKRKNYEQLLFGLYDNDLQAVEQSGLKDEFERSMDKYFNTSFKSINDLYIEDGSVDPNVNGAEFWDMLYEVSENMGFTPEESLRFVEMVDYEERMYLESGQMYAARGGDRYTEPGDRDDRFKWMFDNFQEIYGYPVDFNVDYKRHQESLGFDPNEPTDEMLDQMEQDYISENKPQEGLFNVSLNQSISREHVQTKAVDNAFDNVGAYLKSTYMDEHELELDGVLDLEDRDAFMDIYRDNINYTVDSWKSSTLDVSDPNTLNDLMAISTVRSVNQFYEIDDIEDAYTISEAYSMIQQTFGGELDQQSTNEYLDGYKVVNQVPLDASLRTINEVRREMGEPEDATIDGELNYYDVYKAETPDDIHRLRRDLERTVQGEMMREVEDSMSDYNDYVNAINSDEEEIEDEDEWDLDL